MRRPALALAWLSKWQLLEQTSLPEPGWLSWQLARRPAWQRQVLQQQAWLLVLQPVLQQLA
jgi:hypothetical protein